MRQPQTCKCAFSEQVNRLSDNDSDNNRWLQGVIPDMIISALHLEHLENKAYGRFGDATTLGDIRALAPGQVYSESPSAAFGASAQKRAEKYTKTTTKLRRSSTRNSARIQTQLSPSRQR